MKKFIFFICGILFFSTIYGQNTSKMNQANFLFGFARLLNWSEYQDNTFVINVYGQSVVTDYINNISFSNTSGGRKVEAHQTTLANIANAKILYITKENLSQLSMINELIGQKQVLVVSESPGYTNSGADVSFSYKIITEQDSVLSYTFNLNSIRAKNIKVSPEFIGYGLVR